MPLIKSKSKKAFSHNIEAEMDAGKPKAQSLAIAYNIKNKNKRKMMAEGGSVKEEMRPMPKQLRDDKMMVDKQNMSSAPIAKPKFSPIARPRMANSTVIKARPIDALGRHLDEMEKHEESTMLPMKHEGMSEDKGPKKFAKGGMINDKFSMRDAEEDEVVHPEGLESDNDERTMPVDEYVADHVKMLADGGIIDEQPEDEEHEEHHASVAAAIMAKKARQMKLMSDSEDDKEVMMAEGGMVDIMSNGAEHPNAYYRRNQEILKENYDSDMEGVDQPEDSNEHGDAREMDSENKRDMISVIRRKMMAKRK